MQDELVIQELRELAARKNGIVQAEDVVDAARSETSHLHKHFEWSDGKAAHQWRLTQARQLIRVTVEYVGPADDRRKSPVFVSIAEDRTLDGGGYRLMVDVMADAQARERMLADAMKELERIRLKYRELTELAKVFDAMMEAYQQIGNRPPALPQSELRA